MVSPEQHKWLKAEGFSRGISIGEVVRQLIDEAKEKRIRSGSGSSTPKPAAGTR
jgi:hypothetical protein